MPPLARARVLASALGRAEAEENRAAAEHAAMREQAIRARVRRMGAAVGRLRVQAAFREAIKAAAEASPRPLAAG